MINISPVPEALPVQLRGVVKHYGAVKAVDGVDLAVQRGEVFGLIGHNGAGKSTLFKMMLGLIEPGAGEILVGGVPVGGAGFRSARRQLGYLPENVVLYDNLSGLETLQFFARLKDAPVSQCAGLLERVGLAHATTRPVREYSKGMRQRLGFAQALLGEPRVLFLDEPSNGLDPQAIRDFYAILRDLRNQGVTIIITSHILAELQERVDRLAIMANGRIQGIGSVQQLREQVRLPLRLSLRLAQADALRCQSALASMGNVQSELSTEGVVASCARADKMAVLALVHALGVQLLDLTIQEPSLEDVFFGF